MFFWQPWQKRMDHQKLSVSKCERHSNLRHLVKCHRKLWGQIVYIRLVLNAYLNFSEIIKGRGSEEKGCDWFMENLGPRNCSNYFSFKLFISRVWKKSSEQTFKAYKHHINNRDHQNAKPCKSRWRIYIYIYIYITYTRTLATGHMRLTTCARNLPNHDTNVWATIDMILRFASGTNKARPLKQQLQNGRRCNDIQRISVEMHHTWLRRNASHNKRNTILSHKNPRTRAASTKGRTTPDEQEYGDWNWRIAKGTKYVKTLYHQPMGAAQTAVHPRLAEVSFIYVRSMIRLWPAEGSNQSRTLGHLGPNSVSVEPFHSGNRAPSTTQNQCGSNARRTEGGAETNTHTHTHTHTVCPPTCISWGQFLEQTSEELKCARQSRRWGFTQTHTFCPPIMVATTVSWICRRLQTCSIINTQHP